MYNMVVNKFEVEINKKNQYGSFEHEDGDEKLGGGLWFENDELIAYSGCCSTLPTEVAEALVKLGFKINVEDFVNKDKKMANKKGDKNV